MKNKIFVYGLLPVLALSVLGPKAASAMGFGWFDTVDTEEVASRFQNMFQNQAQLLGISLDELKTKWAEGKSLREIMDEKDISQEQVETRLKEMRFNQVKSQLQILVSKGVITQAQADSRLKAMEDHLDKASLKKERMGRMGLDFGGFGFRAKLK